LISFTKLSANSFDFERQVQRFLVMERSLLVGVAEALRDQAQVNARVRRRFDRIEGLTHAYKIDRLAPRVQPAHSPPKKTGWWSLHSHQPAAFA
jgi:hypothetical protein